MSAIAIELPEDVRTARDGLLAFAEHEVVPRHTDNSDLFENPRRVYRENGRFSDEVIELIREVRMASSAAGFYQMCVPEELGGGGRGHLA
jgi:alkylation response protein AidB-like acyl-CoA dehydrogenase